MKIVTFILYCLPCYSLLLLNYNFKIISNKWSEYIGKLHDLRSLVPQIPDDLVNIINKGLAENVEDRFKDAYSFSNELMSIF